MAKRSAWPTYKSASMHVLQPESSKAKPASAGLFASVLHDASALFWLAQAAIVLYTLTLASGRLVIHNKLLRIASCNLRSARLRSTAPTTAHCKTSLRQIPDTSAKQGHKIPQRRWPATRSRTRSLTPASP